MPAEIDTGGPRVLHCVERADCPIPRGPPPTTPLPILTNPAYRRSPTSRRSLRSARDRRYRSTLRSTPLDFTEPPILPGSDEANEFYRYELSTTSSNDLEGAATPRDRRARQRDNLPRHRRNRARDDTEVQPGDVASSCCLDVPSVGEISPIDDTRQRLPASTATIDVCHPLRLLDKNRCETIGESSGIVIRLYDGRRGCGTVVSESGDTPCPIIGKLQAAISSQRDGNPVINEERTSSRTNPQRDEKAPREYSVECAWQWESECVCECPGDESRSARCSAVKVTRERRKRYRRNQHKGRSSYLQLALLLFLLAFGHSSLLRLNSGGFGGRSGVGTGIGALTIGTIVGAVRAVPLDLDAGVRAERSANLSHITGVSRKIQMYIKNRHLQILPDGSVNGSNDDTSEYTIFQRTSVSRGQLRIQGVATCLYLCMDSCGLLYGSREYTDDCVFNETLEQHNYNSYSSVRWSTAKKTLYLGLNRWGQPRRVQAKGHNLGRLSAYARVLTQVAPPDRVEALQARMLGAQHNLRHHHNSHHHRNVQQTVCPNLPPQEKDGRDKFRCRKRKKRKKRRRRCNKGEKPGPHCELAEEHRGGNAEITGEGPPQSKRSCEGAASEELCRKQALDAPAKKRKSRIESVKPNDKEKQQRNKGKEVRPKKTADNPKKAHSAGSPVVDEETIKRGANGPNGGKRKRPLAKQRPGAANRKKLPGRVTRTSAPVSPTVPSVTVPSSWYPGASTTPSSETLAAAEISSWRRTKTAASPRNAVTTGELKLSGAQSSRIGKALDALAFLPDSFVNETSTEAEDHFASINETSAENSEETKSDEFTLDDDLTTSSAEYSTLMTTMDTTPPERTEDYTRATTPSMFASLEVDARDLDDIQSPVESRNRDFGRLAM